MAGIDKMYVKKWSDYCEVRDFCNRFGRVKDDFGNIFYPSEFLVDYSEAEFTEIIEYQRERYRTYYSDPSHIQEAKEWNGDNWEPNIEEVGEVVIWNTPAYFDIWLIRSCEIPIIVKRLKQQYSDYEEIKSKNSEYDHYIKPAVFSHFSIHALYNFRASYYHIQVSDTGWWYSEETGEWSYWKECKMWNTNTADIRGPLTKRKLARILKKWGFPAGLTLRGYSSCGDVFEIILK